MKYLSRILISGVILPINLVIPSNDFTVTPEIPNNSPNQAIEQSLELHKVNASNDACLKELWGKESNWEAGRINPKSNAVGIPQALPPTKLYPDFHKMEKEWRDGKYYLVNPDREKEIEWGLKYIEDRYGNSCEALYFWKNVAPTYDKFKNTNWY